LRENSEEKIRVVSDLEIKGQEKKKRKGMIFLRKIQNLFFAIPPPPRTKKIKIKIKIFF